jgi:GNAT superfamily N-acetyltransferase
MGIRDIVALLSSVGFSSPPAWLRPFGVLSNGEQFRATVARALAESDELVVMDEFTSVVDRNVAQIGSAAIAKTVRARGGRFIASTCHYDVEEWLQPDWVYQPHLNEFRWRSVQPRPQIELDIYRCHSEAWRLFGPHHYLDHNLNKAAACWVGMWEGKPVVFSAVLPFPHAHIRNAYRSHRLVTLPDYQGVGIGYRFCDYLAGVYKAAGRRFLATSAHPARVGVLARSKNWKMTSAPKLNPSPSASELAKFGKSMKRAQNRFTASFEFVGPAQPDSPLLAELTRPAAQLA